VTNEELHALAAVTAERDRLREERDAAVEERDHLRRIYMCVYCTTMEAERDALAAKLAAATAREADARTVCQWVIETADEEEARYVNPAGVLAHAARRVLASSSAPPAKEEV
jgi:hypothetical protein